MKKIVLLVFGLVLAFSLKDAFAETSTKDADSIAKFYKAYAKAFCEPDFIKSYEKCDSVMAIYCTPALCRDTKEDRGGTGICYDYATDDEGADELSINTLKVTSHNDYYIVTYQTNTINDRNQKYIKSVKLQVTMSNGKITKVKSIK